jgi:MFS family permease
MDTSKESWARSLLCTHLIATFLMLHQMLEERVGSPLSSGVFAEVFSRKQTMFGGALWVVLGSFLAAGAQAPAYLFAGRLFTGLGVGTLSAIG